jgi:hypothetical protein
MGGGNEGSEVTKCGEKGAEETGGEIGGGNGQSGSGNKKRGSGENEWTGDVGEVDSGGNGDVEKDGGDCESLFEVEMAVGGEMKDDFCGGDRDVTDGLASFFSFDGGAIRMQGNDNSGRRRKTRKGNHTVSDKETSNRRRTIKIRWDALSTDQADKQDRRRL